MVAPPSPAPCRRVRARPLDVRFYGLLIAIGVLVALRVLRAGWRQRGGDPDALDGIAIAAVGFGFLGARTAYVLPRLEAFAERPWAVLAVWEGGLALFGGLIGGTLALAVLLRRRGFDVVDVLDAAAPGVALAQAIGRWGNSFNQELYGTPTDLPWALRVDPDARVARFADATTFHPTFLYESLLYESLWNLTLGGLILALDRRGRLPRGVPALLYVMGYGIGRSWIELLRTDTTYRLLGLSRNSWVALVVALGGLVALALRLRAVRAERRRRPETMVSGG